MLDKINLFFVCLFILGVSLLCSTAHAALDLTGITVDTTPVFSMAVIVITGLAAIWAIWKTIGIVRSR